MSGSDPNLNIIDGFVKESIVIIDRGQGLLDKFNDGEGSEKDLIEFANLVDRILGAAQNLRLVSPKHQPALTIIADVAALCKALGYRAVMIYAFQDLVNLTANFLLDATDLIKELLSKISEPAASLKDEVRNILLERLRWINKVHQKISTENKSFDSEKLKQQDIDELMKKLGLG